MDGPPVTTEMAKRALLIGAARAHGLVEAVPARFKARGWDCDDRVHIATAALACVALNVGKTRFRIFPGTDDPPCWAAITGVTEARKIVEALEIGDLLKAPHLSVSVTS